MKPQICNKNQHPLNMMGKLIEKKPDENPIDFSSVDARILKLSAEIDLIQSEEIPEFKRLKLISSLRILQSRTQLALSSLNTKAESFKLLDSKLIKK